MAEEAKRFYCSLSKLHSLLDEANKGSHSYRNFYTLRKVNGDNCQYIGLAAGMLEKEKFLNTFENELHAVIKAYREYTRGRSIDPEVRKLLDGLG